MNVTEIYVFELKYMFLYFIIWILWIFRKIGWVFHWYCTYNWLNAKCTETFKNEIYAIIKFYWFSNQILTIYTYILISRIFTNSPVFIARFYRASSAFAKTLVRRERKRESGERLEYYTLRWFKCGEANIAQMHVLCISMRRFSERLHKSGIHCVAVSDYLNIACVSNGLITY